MDHSTDLQGKYNDLNQNYKLLQDKYDKMVKRLELLEENAPNSKVASTTSDTSTSLPSPNEISSMKNDALKASQSISELQDFFSHVDNTLAGLTNRLDDIDQYMRCNALVIKGLDDVPAKTYGVAFSKYVLEKLQSLLPSIANKLKIEDISISHPLPSKQKSLVIVKFVRRDIKNLIFYEKRELKKSGTKVSITEHLTKKKPMADGRSKEDGRI